MSVSPKDIRRAEKLIEEEKWRREFICNYLLELRKSKGWSHKQVAKKLVIDRSMYTMYEMGKRTPSPKMVRKIARVYGITSSELRKRIFKYELGKLKGRWGIR